MEYLERLFESAYIGAPLFPLPMGFLNDNNVMVPNSPVEGTILSSSSVDWEVLAVSSPLAVQVAKVKEGASQGSTLSLWCASE